MPAQLLLGSGRGRFVDASARAGDCWKVERIGRGLAVGDLDGDGRVDRHESLKPGGAYLLVEGEPAPRPASQR